jgi:hypothetical protein
VLRRASTACSCETAEWTASGSGACFVKFGAVSPGHGASDRFESLLDAIESVAAERSCSRVTAGVNTARHRAHRTLLQRGYRPILNGLTMLRPNERAYDRPDAYVIDDLR